MDELGDDTTLSFECSKCWNRFKNSHALRAHKKAHAVPNQCLPCTTVFESDEALQIHNSLHHGPKFECEACRKKSEKLEDMALHVLRHRELQGLDAARVSIGSFIKKI